MNAQERDQLNQFLKPLTEVRLPHKDTEAERLILEAAKQQPDAVYLLVQRALLLEQALNSAKVQINDLQNQLQNSQTSSNGRNGFLSNDPWAQPVANSGPVPGVGRYSEPRYASPQQQNPGFLGGGGSSFLGSVASTAAGVVAGSFLFQGIENLMGHHASSTSSWMDQTSAHNGYLSENTTINNYYGDQAADADLQQASFSDYATDEDTDSFQDDGESDWI